MECYPVSQMCRYSKLAAVVTDLMKNALNPHFLKEYSTKVNETVWKYNMWQ